jgi:hypothetical protein
MISVTAPIWLWSGRQASWHFVTIPEDEALEIRAHNFGGDPGSGRSGYRQR